MLATMLAADCSVRYIRHSHSFCLKCNLLLFTCQLLLSVTNTSSGTASTNLGVITQQRPVVVGLSLKLTRS
jgi:hypothetical protein